MRPQIKISVPLAGGELQLIDQDGEVQNVIALAAGLHNKSDYDIYIGKGQSVQMSEGVTLLKPQNKKMGSTQGDQHYSVGANPLFTPERHTKVEKQLIKALQQVNERQKASDKMRAAAENIYNQKMKVESDKLEEQQRVKAEADALEKQRLLDLAQNGETSEEDPTPEA